jgi:SAM-dependent methyltransferase
MEVFLSASSMACPGWRWLRHTYLSALFCMVLCVGSCSKDTDCVAGRAGCPCTFAHACEAGSECYRLWCWGGEYPLPDSYFYGQKNMEDGDGIRELIIEYMKLEPGMKVADIGCGHGSYTSGMARRVGPDGVVYATDIDDRALEWTQSYLKKLRDAAYGRLETVLLSKRRDTGLDNLPAATLTAILMINSASFHYHEDEEMNAAYLRRFRRVLKPGGHLIYHRNWIQSDDLGRDDTIAIFGRAGFELDPVQIAMPARIPPKSIYYPQGPREEGTPLSRGFLLVFRQPEGTP